MLIGALIVVSAIVSWVGDVVGMKLGKKRITFMRLRPKYTSRIISVITGVGIALVTLVALSLASETVRTALFSMNYVQNQITSLTAELQKNRDSLAGMSVELFESKGDLQEKQEALSRVEEKLAEGTKALRDARKQLADMKALKDKTEAEQTELIKEKLRLEGETGKLEKSVNQLKRESDLLKKESESLKAGIQRLREGRIAALTGEILAQGIVPADKTATAAQTQQMLDRLVDEARALLAYRFGKKAEEIKPPQLSADSVQRVRSQIAGSQARWLVRMTALSNAVEGEPVMAKVTPHRTQQIYKAREVLAEHRFTASMPKEKVEEQIFRVLREVNTRAAAAGVLRDPLTGNLGSIDTEEFMNAIEKIVESKKNTTLQISAANDIYTEGPVRVKFILK